MRGKTCILTAPSVVFGSSETRQDSFHVRGRGELQLSILLETMRREGSITTSFPALKFPGLVVDDLCIAVYLTYAFYMSCSNESLSVSISQVRRVPVRHCAFFDGAFISCDCFRPTGMSGRTGEVLMRFEMTLSPPTTIRKTDEDGTVLEPWEEVRSFH